MTQKIVHGREYTCIVGNSSQHHSVIPEGILNRLMGIIPAEIAYRHFLPASGFQHLFQLESSFFRMPIHRRIRDENPPILRLIPAPDIIFANIICQIFRQHRSMQRTDNRNIQRGKFFQKCLYLHTIFPANVDIIPPGLTGPVFRSIPCPEFTKPICTEHNLFRLLICDMTSGQCTMGAV